MKCLLGYYRADDGAFLIDGREETIARPADADRLGLGMVYQHFTLVPSMTVAENLVMSRATVPAVIDWRRERAELDAFMARMPFRVPLDAQVGSARRRRAAEDRDPQAALPAAPVPRARRADLRADAAGGARRCCRWCATWRMAAAITVLIITHKLKEVARFADDVTVLRRGRLAGAGGKARGLAPQK